MESETQALRAPVHRDWSPWLQLFRDLEDLHARMWHLASFLHALRSANTQDLRAEQEYGKFTLDLSAFQKIYALLTNRIKVLDDEAFESLCQLDELRDAEYFLKRLRIQAQYLMSDEMEMLASDLEVSGIRAWGRLYEQIIASLSFELEDKEGTVKTVPFAWKMSLLEDADPKIRAQTLERSNQSLEVHAKSFAAALNHIAGSRLTLMRWRKQSDYLEPSLFDAGITAKTLKAMMEVLEEDRHIPQKYLKAKAKLLGKPRLYFSDLLAPLPTTPEHVISWYDAKQRILDAYGSLDSSMKDFAQMAFDRRWIEAEPREHKREGAYCTTSLWIGESRIFTTFRGTEGDLETLAHELGHAFHSWTMRGLRPWAREYPMTLAETASIFAETLMSDRALANSRDPKQQLAILDKRLERAATFMLNLPMRFTFERAFYEKRKQGEVSIDELNALMIREQRHWYGDALDPNHLDPWFWASKQHFYFSGISFYNYPYSFGFLFSLGLFHRLKSGQINFGTYVEILKKTGSMSAEDLIHSILGEDIQSPEFWKQSLIPIRKDLEKYQSMLDKL